MSTQVAIRCADIVLCDSGTREAEWAEASITLDQNTIRARANTLVTYADHIASKDPVAVTTVECMKTLAAVSGRACGSLLMLTGVSNALAFASKHRGLLCLHRGDTPIAYVFGLNMQNAEGDTLYGTILIHAYDGVRGTFSYDTMGNILEILGAPEPPPDILLELLEFDAKLDVERIVYSYRTCKMIADYNPSWGEQGAWNAVEYTLKQCKKHPARYGPAVAWDPVIDNIQFSLPLLREPEAGGKVNEPPIDVLTVAYFDGEYRMIGTTRLRAVARLAAFSGDIPGWMRWYFRVYR